MTGDDYARYLARLRLERIGVGPEGLAQLQRAHQAAIPFEGIDPFLGIEPALTPGALSAKMLHAGRGGYCFEQNLLLDAALRHAGFAVRQVLARVRQRQPQPGPRSHLALVVTLDGVEWLTDCGFGGPGPHEPLQIRPGAQRVSNGLYRLVEDAVTEETVVERMEEDGWAQLFGFDRAPVLEADLVAANYLAAHWPGSPFTGNLLLGGQDGPLRLGLFNRRLTESGPGGSNVRELADAAELSALMARIGLAAPEALAARLWERLP